MSNSRGATERLKGRMVKEAQKKGDVSSKAIRRLEKKAKKIAEQTENKRNRQ